MQIRDYRSEDCAEIAELFYNTVHTVNAKDYTAPQLYAWATGNVNLEMWDRSFRMHRTVVSVEGNLIVGFGDIDRTGYLDRLYVHKDFQSRGIAMAICDVLEQSVPECVITTHVSVTAKPFFEKRGYRVIKEQNVLRQGISLTNYLMEKPIGVPQN